MVKRVLLSVVVVVALSGCATESDSDRFGWDDVKDKVASVLKDDPAAAKAKAEAQEANEEQYRASPNSFKY